MGSELSSTSLLEAGPGLFARQMAAGGDMGLSGRFEVTRSVDFSTIFSAGSRGGCPWTEVDSSEVRSGHPSSLSLCPVRCWTEMCPLWASVGVGGYKDRVWEGECGGILCTHE
jgi:hypothetical protein